MAEKIALSDILAQIADELTLAEENARRRGFAVMQFQECEIEFAVQAEKQAGGGIKVWFINLGGGVKRSDENTIRLKFTNISNMPMQAPQTSQDAEEGPALERQRTAEQ
jgi:copper(I)-binding protein